jgi:hypothetical protein
MMIIRLLHAIWAWCARCMVRTQHSVTANGDYEEMSCQDCGTTTVYRTR